MASGHGGLHSQTMSQDNRFLPLVAYIRYSVMATRKLFWYLPGMLFCVMCNSVGCAVTESGPCSDEHPAFLRQICFLGPSWSQSWRNLTSLLLLNRILGATAFNQLHSDSRVSGQQAWSGNMVRGEEINKFLFELYLNGRVQLVMWMARFCCFFFYVLMFDTWLSK